MRFSIKYKLQLRKRYYFQGQNLTMRILIIGFFIVLCSSSSAQVENDLVKIQQCSMINISGPDGVGVGWWLTDQYWELVVGANPNFDAASKRDILRILGENTLFLVAIGVRDQEEMVRFPSFEGLKNTMTLYGQDSLEYFPLEDDELSEDFLFVLDIFRPVYAKMLGQFGENLHFFAFPKTNSKGELIANPLESTDITLAAGGKSFSWELPLSALVPEKRCPDDNALLNGTWNYCPFHGTELEVVED